MPNQEYITNSNQDTFIPANNLNNGELGEIVNSHNFNGLIVTKAFDIIVCVYSANQEYPAFETIWKDNPTFKVRRLNLNEIIKLHN